MNKKTNFILAAYTEYNRQLTDFIEVLNKYFTDSSVEINERWETYQKLNHVYEYSNARKFKELFNDDKIYDFAVNSYYKNEYNRIEFKDLIVYLLETLYDDDKYSDDELEVIENNLKLIILRSGYRGVRFK